MAVYTYKCPGCDGELTFDPAKQLFVCDYCGGEYARSDLSDQDRQAEADTPPSAAQEEAAFIQQAALYSCPSCGAEVIVDASTAATTCFYCHNPVVLTGRLSGDLRPQQIIPFAIDKAAAEESFLRFCKKKWFLPKHFSTGARRESLTGLYLPYWLVDCTVDGLMHATGETVRVWRSGDVEYTERSYYALTRGAQIDYGDLTLNALRRVDTLVAEGVQPYDFSRAQPFAMPYLSGFQAEKRLVERADAAPEAQSQVQDYTKSLLLGAISGYSNVSVQDLQCRLLREDWRYILLPVWMMTYQYKNKSYYYAVNGQTGKMTCNVPLSKGKLALLFGIVTLAVFLILLIGGALGWLD